jgi:hypothetical protein
MADATRAEERSACVTIRTDESVPAVAVRVTGDARNMWASWFQIVNPTTSRRVPKERYHLKFAGWSACIVDLRLPQDVRRASHQIAAAPSDSGSLALRTAPVAAPIQSAAASDAPPRGRSAITWGTVAFGGCVVIIAIACWGDEFLNKRARALRAMKRFADRFVREFERPLIQQHIPGRPIQSQVRFKPFRSRLDVLLAPDSGLRYPNLTDHKNNVVYDVGRVQEVLQDRAFVSGRPYARGQWVIVPFQLRFDVREAGDR